MRRVLFVAGLVLAWILAESYFYTPIAVGIAVGTVMVTILTKIVNYPRAALQNSFFLSVGWVGISFASANFLPDAAFSGIIVFLAYAALIKSIYAPKKLLPILILATISTIFRKAVGLLLLGPFTDAAYSLLIY